MYCPACGVRMTAKPVEAEAELGRRPGHVAGGRGDGSPRLPFAVLVDNVRSLFNIGAIFRTADAFGVARLVLCGISGCPPRPEISKTALGAEKAVPWDYSVDPLRALESLRRDGYRPLALEATERSVPLHEVRWPDRPCLVLGNEVAGVSGAVLDSCGLHVAIPMLGTKDSLNVAVAFGITAHRIAAALTEPPQRSG
jgi:tRNA G18 (ribose-2'-O)-methylase SpoU